MIFGYYMKNGYLFTDSHLFILEGMVYFFLLLNTSIIFCNASFFSSMLLPLVLYSFLITLRGTPTDKNFCSSLCTFKYSSVMSLISITSPIFPSKFVLLLLLWLALVILLFLAPSFLRTNQLSVLLFDVYRI